MFDIVFMDRYTGRLNDQQKEAVLTTDGPILLLAVPGSGKTTVLVTRLGYMILCKGILPEYILTLTYTRAATRGMRERFSDLFGEEVANRTEFRTINGICAKIISYYANTTGRTPFELVTDDKAIGRVLAEIMQQELSEYPTESEISQARTEIAYCKNMMLSVDEIEEREKQIRFEGLASIFKKYNDYLIENKLMDYDDQMVYSYRILRQSPDILAHYRETFRYVCVDEAQDTSKIQHEIIKLIAGQNGNLFMVGDEDQSIYGFRAAYPDALLNFEKDHPSAKVLVMDQNYRSNAKIVKAADTFIKHNKNRHEKSICPTRPEGTDIHYVELGSRRSQYGYLLKVARDCQTQTAVLYRDNESVLPLIDQLERERIPYRLKTGDPGFFTSRVVTDIRNTMLFALRPDDTLLFMSIYFRFNLYLSKRAAEELCRISEKNGKDVLDGLESIRDLNGRVLGNCKAFRTHLKNMKKEPPSKAINRIVKFMGYGEYMESKGLETGKTDTLTMIAYNEGSIGSFLRRLDELQRVFREHDGSSDFILSTIHSAKGLEYDDVYLMDICDGILPKESRGITTRQREQDELEEERRLYYVGMTRAKERLHIFTFKNEPSRFVKETTTPIKDVRAKIRDTVKSIMDVGSNDVPEPVIGLPILHKKFGNGIITDVTYEQDVPTQIEVEFETGSIKNFAYPFVFENGNMTVSESNPSVDSVTGLIESTAKTKEVEPQTNPKKEKKKSNRNKKPTSYAYWEERYPNHVVVKKEGYFYSAHGQSAVILSGVMGYKLGGSEEKPVTGSPAVEDIIRGLTEAEQKFVVIDKGKIVAENGPLKITQEKNIPKNQ